ncbi:hypothetical protein PQX77_022374 [Marasmius sp. AFHP31]|nr:hypothetical protein PQX77_022374 [Marasmius sp. AFHP31]
MDQITSAQAAQLLNSFTSQNTDLIMHSPTFNNSAQQPTLNSITTNNEHNFSNAPGFERLFTGEPGYSHPLTILALAYPQYTRQNQGLFNQIRMISAEVLQSTENSAYMHLERERQALQLEVQELRRNNGALQTSFMAMFADARAAGPAREPAAEPVQPSATSASASASPKVIKHQPEHKKEKPEGCRVEWWNQPPSKDPKAFEIVKKTPYKFDNHLDSDSDDDNSESELQNNSFDDGDIGKKNEGIFAWMQHFDGTLVSFSEKKEAYKDHRRFWNGLELSQPPRNYSSIKHTQIDDFVTFMEERHDWLALCSGHWKAHEILKSNYKSWKKTYLSRQNKEAAKEKKDKKKERKEKRKERERGPDSEQRIVSDVSNEREGHDPHVVVNLCSMDFDSDDNEAVIREAGPSTSELPQATNISKSATEGTISSKKLSESIIFAPIDVAALEKKAIDNMDSPASVPSGRKLADDVPMMLAPTPPSAPADVPSLQTKALDNIEPATVPSGRKPINFIEKFAAKVKGLPQSVPCAKKGGAFTQYSANDPSTYTKGIPTKELWPRFDTPLTLLIPSGDHEARKPLVTRGVYGLPALVKFLKHLVYDRGMDPFVLEPKLERLTETIDLVVAVLGKRPEEPKAAAKLPAKRKDSQASVGDAKRPVKKSKKSSENSKNSNAPDNVEVTGTRMETVGGSK